MSYVVSPKMTYHDSARMNYPDSARMSYPDEKLDCVNRFKYLGAIIVDVGSKPEILARIAQATAASPNLRLSGMTGI